MVPKQYTSTGGRSSRCYTAAITRGGCVSFRLIATCPTTGARAGLLSTAHGELLTPAFMPVGTLANVKTLTPVDLQMAGARCVLANAYHLALRPGAEMVSQLG